MVERRLFSKQINLPKEPVIMDKSHEINKIPFYELLTDEQKKEVLDHSKIKAFGKECRIAGI